MALQWGGERPARDGDLQAASRRSRLHWLASTLPASPLGMDLLFAFAFDRPPAEFEKVLTLRKLDPTDPRLALIERLLAERKGEFSFARAELRVLSGD